MHKGRRYEILTKILLLSGLAKQGIPDWSGYTGRTHEGMLIEILKMFEALRTVP